MLPGIQVDRDGLRKTTNSLVPSELELKSKTASAVNSVWVRVRYIRTLWTEHMLKEVAGRWTRELTSLSAGPGTGSVCISLSRSDNEQLHSDKLLGTIDSQTRSCKADCRCIGRHGSPVGCISRKYTRYLWNLHYLNYLFTVYLTTLSPAQGIQHQMIKLLMNNELERIGKDEVAS